MARAADYDVHDDCLARFRMILAGTPRGSMFGNGRFARNLLEAAVGRHAWRLRDIGEPTIDQLRLLLAEDLDDDSTTDPSTSSGIEPTGSGIEPTGSGIEPTGSGIEPTGSGIEPTGSGIEPTGSGTRSDGLRDRRHRPHLCERRRRNAA